VVALSALKGGMRTVLLATMILALPASAARAQQVRSHKPDQAPPSDKVLPLKGTAGVNSCAVYGPGFVKVEGSGTCVKIGGAIGVEVSGGRR
jgi:hypothetical protein